MSVHFSQGQPCVLLIYFFTLGTARLECIQEVSLSEVVSLSWEMLTSDLARCLEHSIIQCN